MEAPAPCCYRDGVPGLDPRTLIVVSAVIPLTLAGILVGVRAMRRMPAGFGVWTLSQAVIALGAGLVAARGFAPDWASIVLGNLLVVLGVALLDEGFRRFYGLARWVPRWLDAAVLAGSTAIAVAHLHGSVNLRIASASAVYAFYLARAGGGPLRSVEGRQRRAQWVLSALELAGAAMLLVRAVSSAAAPPYSELFSEGWTVMIPGIVLMLVNATSMYVALVLSYERSEAQLRTALSEVKTLSGLLPICMHCHKIRNDRGYWDSLERYLAHHTEATFSHGICPDCYDENYAGTGTDGTRLR